MEPHRTRSLQQYRADDHRSAGCLVWRNTVPFIPIRLTRPSPYPPLSAEIARNTQKTIAIRPRPLQFIDGLGGSTVIEERTESLMAEANALIEEIEEAGGMTKAIEQGIPKQRIEASAAEKASSY